MAITLVTASRNLACDAIVDALDPSGLLVLRTAGGAEVATLALSATAFGSAATGTATANAISDDTSATGGTVSYASFETSGNVEVFRCTVTVTGGGGDITMANLTVGAGTTVTLSGSLTVTVAAS